MKKKKSFDDVTDWSNQKNAKDVDVVERPRPGIQLTKNKHRYVINSVLNKDLGETPLPTTVINELQ